MLCDALNLNSEPKFDLFLQTLIAASMLAKQRLPQGGDLLVGGLGVR